MMTLMTACRFKMSNRTIGEQCHDALVEAAKAKAEALRARKKADRTFDIALLKATGANADARKAAARLDPVADAAESEAVEKECAAIVAKAQADGLQILFEAWRSKQATDRAEMTMR
jgi:hypothetical protein